MTVIKLTIAVDRLKVVVRRLPPNLPEDVFWDSVKPWANDDTVQWRSFVAGKISKRTIKENVPARAYIAFKTHESVALFSREYDGHIFRDKSGRETAAVVEFAPYQKIPPTEVKQDRFKDTLLRDAHYTHWLDELENVKKLSEQDTLEAYKSGANEQESKPKTTPLLEALKAEKERAKEAALARRHALAQQEKESKKGGERKGAAKEPAGPAARVDDPAAATAAAAPGKSARTKRRPNPKDKKEKEAAAPKVIITKKPADGQAGSSSPTVAAAKPAKEPGESKKKGAGVGDAEGKPERKRPQISGSRVLDVALSGARKEREKAADATAAASTPSTDATSVPAPRERRETPPAKTVVTAPTPGTPGVLSINPADAGPASPAGKRRRVRTKRQPQAG